MRDKLDDDDPKLVISFIVSALFGVVVLGVSLWILIGVGRWVWSLA